MTRFAVSVLVYSEGNCWVAVAVYLDLLGVGESRSEALESLALMVEAQVSFGPARELRLRLAPGGWNFSELEVLEVLIDGEEDRPVGPERIPPATGDVKAAAPEFGLISISKVTPSRPRRGLERNCDPRKDGTSPHGIVR
jgi:hypothetical protein